MHTKKLIKTLVDTFHLREGLKEDSDVIFVSGIFDKEINSQY